ncbi:MAG TPA: tRNA-dihydrouridine synthase, partial [Candidatus Syntrophosphaera sp.]|nr:tRNA-dihydrouridine synthase [Candidatus Syntrophosphaera sp.]
MVSLADLTRRKLWLAPLAGYTDSAFRQLCKQNGADVLVSEMVSADGLIGDSRKT